jgi:ABC-type molybdenum transport system ATPase subunit/photorepair protein PhrA
MRDQDRQTLRENLLESLSHAPPSPPPTEFTPTQGFEERLEISVREVNQDIDKLAEQLHLSAQLEVPMIALSNGQQRRARILRQLIRKPKLLLLEDPYGECKLMYSGI